MLKVKPVTDYSSVLKKSDIMILISKHTLIYNDLYLRIKVIPTLGTLWFKH